MESNEELRNMGKDWRAYKDALRRRVNQALALTDICFLQGKVSYSAWAEIVEVIEDEEKELLDLEIESAIADYEWQQEEAAD